jgi:hypothetical protein
MSRTAVLTIAVLALLCGAQAGAQLPRDVTQPSRDDQPKMKQSQINELMREDHKKSIEEAARLVELSEELKIELEKKEPSVLSLAAVKKAEEIEKLAKRIRSRMKRY